MVSILFKLSTARKVSLKLSNKAVSQVETKFLDTCLRWKPHLKAVESKAARKLAVMKKLAGITWGTTPTSRNSSTEGL